MVDGPVDIFRGCGMATELFSGGVMTDYFVGFTWQRARLWQDPQREYYGIVKHRDSCFVAWEASHISTPSGPFTSNPK